MKDSKNDSNPALARFGRDKRMRTVTATTERVERRPRQQRDALRDEQPREFKRASFNPNFSRENRPMFDGQPRRFNNDRPAPAGKPYAEKSYGYRKEHNDHTDRFNRYDRDAAPGRSYDDRPRRSYGERPAYEERGNRSNYGGYGHNRRYDEPRDFNRDFNRDRRFDGERRFEKPADGRTPKKPFNKFANNDHFEKPERYGKPAKPGFKKRDTREERPVSYPKYNPEKQTGAIRLNRFIAQSGICSRREADDFIVAGVVTVNGEVVTELGTKVFPTDEVRFNDERIQGEKKVYLVLNKPKGYVTSLEDPHATKTVMELVKGACTERIYPVGRLDKNSLGLLLFTNDGDMTKQLTHPTYQKKKVYQVTLDKQLTRADMDRIAEGITLEDGEIHADEIAYVKENKQEIGIEIHSGRNRIVRRIFEFLGYEVKKLDRVYYAGLTKKNLKRGAWRFLTDEEVRRLKTGQYE